MSPGRPHTPTADFLIGAGSNWNQPLGASARLSSPADNVFGCRRGTKGPGAIPGKASAATNREPTLRRRKTRRLVPVTTCAENTSHTVADFRAAPFGKQLAITRDDSHHRVTTNEGRSSAAKVKQPDTTEPGSSPDRFNRALASRTRNEPPNRKARRQLLLRFPQRNPR